MVRSVEVFVLLCLGGFAVGPCRGPWVCHGYMGGYAPWVARRGYVAVSRTQLEGHRTEWGQRATYDLRYDTQERQTEGGRGIWYWLIGQHKRAHSTLTQRTLLFCSLLDKISARTHARA
jgi:hypothetical protein